MSQNRPSLIDCLHFLKRAYKSILITGLAGLGRIFACLAETPKQYEVIAQIATVQIGAANLNSLGVNIVQPSLLIARLSSLTSFTPRVLSSYVMDEGPNPEVALARAIKFALPKGIVNEDQAQGRYTRAMAGSRSGISGPII